jgi:hypothetical protein
MKPSNVVADERPPFRLVQRKGAKPRKAPAGTATNDLVFTAHAWRY